MHGVHQIARDEEQWIVEATGMFPVTVVSQDKQLQHSINYSTQPWLFHAFLEVLFNKKCTFLFLNSAEIMHTFIFYLT
jgi:hypothetical protein